MVAHGPANVVPLIGLWRDAAARHAARPALQCRDGSAVTFEQTSAAAMMVTDALREHGVGPGTPVLVDLTRGPIWLPVLLGVWQAGAVVVPVHPSDRGPVGAGAWTTVEITDGDQKPDSFWPNGFAIHRTRASSPAAVTPAHAYAMPTSGTTGTPKRALITHATSAAVLRGLRDAVRIEVGERAMHTAAFSFSSSMRQLLVPLLSGASVSIVDRGERFDPSDLLHVAHAQGITSLDLTPSQLSAVVRWLEIDRRSGETPTLGELRRLLVASEVLSPALLGTWRRLVTTPHLIFHLYGQTETGGAISVLPLPPQGTEARLEPAERLPLATPFPPFSAHIVADDRSGLGELQIAGLDASDGYLTPTGLDRSRFTGSCGGFRTGDLFTRRRGGLLEFRGRTDSEIKVLGIRIDTDAAEQALNAVPGIIRAAVVAVPRSAGESLRVVYSAHDRGRVEPALAETAARMFGPSVPVPELIGLNSLPETTSGKVDRVALRRLESPILDRSPARPSLEDLWRRYTHPTSEIRDRDFFAAGGHSLSMLELLADLSRAFGIRIRPEEFHRNATLAGLQQLIQGSEPAVPPAAGPDTQMMSSPAGATGLQLSTLQRQILIGEQLAQQAVSPFWLAVDLETTGHIDSDRLGSALRAVATRFDVLRTAFVRRRSEVTIRPEPRAAAEFPVHRTGSPHEPVPAQALGGVIDDTPLIQLGVVERTSATTVGLRVHHAVADRASLIHVLSALADAYNHPGAFAALPPAPSYQRWQAAQQERARTGRQAAGAYWDMALPTPLPRVPPGLAAVERLALSIPAITPSAAGTTPHATWLWAFRCALAGLGTGENLIGIDVDLRSSADRLLVGPCVTTLPVVLPEGDVDGPHAAREVMAAIARTLEHRDVPIAEVVPSARRPTGDPRQPFYRNSFVHQVEPYPALSFDGREVSYRRTPPGIPISSVNLYVRHRGMRTDIEVAWRTDCFSSHVARSLIEDVARRGSGQEAQP